MLKALRTNRTVIYFLRGLSNIFASLLGYFIARNRWFWRNICTCLNIYDSTNLWLLESIWYIMYKFMYMLLPPYDMIDTIWLLMKTNNLVCIVCIKQWDQKCSKKNSFLYYLIKVNTTSSDVQSTNIWHSTFYQFLSIVKFLCGLLFSNFCATVIILLGFC